MPKSARRPVKTTRTKAPRAPGKSRRTVAPAKKVVNRRRSTRARSSNSSANSGFLNKLLSWFRLPLLVLTVLMLLGGFLHVWLIPQVVLDVEEPQLLLVVPERIPEEAAVARLLLVRLDPSGEHSVSQLAGDQPVTVGRYGSYQLAMVYPLLELDNQSDQYVRSVFSQVLGLPLHQVVAADPIVSTAAWRPFAFEQVRTAFGQTAWWQIAYGLQQHGALEEEPVASTEVIRALTEQWPTIAPQLAQKCPIAVTNGTKTSGLASYTSALIEHAGGLVIRVATEYDMQPETSIVVDQTVPECAVVAQTISRFFPSVEVIADDQQLTGQYRSRILVLLGADMDSFRPAEQEAVEK